MSASITDPTPQALDQLDRSAADAGVVCGERNPERRGICTRPPGHNGGHLNQRLDAYWQATS